VSVLSLLLLYLWSLQIQAKTNVAGSVIIQAKALSLLGKKRGGFFLLSLTEIAVASVRIQMHTHHHAHTLTP
jgi:hypothetical protein